MLSCSIWFSAPSFWMGGGLESRCMGRVYGARFTFIQDSRPFWKCVIPVVCVRTGKRMQTNTTVSIKMFNDYIRQLHVSAPTGHISNTLGAV